MRMFLKIGKWLLALVIFAVAALAGWTYKSPPELFKVGAGYSAKIVCSNVFIAGRDPDEVLRIDVQAPGHWLLDYMGVDVDREAKTVRAGLLGIFGNGLAVARDGFGCTSVPDGKLDAVLPVPALEAAPAPSDAVWPEGNSVAAVAGPGDRGHPRRRQADRTGHARRGRRAKRAHRRRALRRGLFARNAAARLVDDQVGDRGNHRHAGQGTASWRSTRSNCSSRGRPTAARRSASPT